MNVKKRLLKLEAVTPDKTVLNGLGEFYKELQNPNTDTYKSNQLLYDDNRPHPNPSHPDNIKYFDKQRADENYK